MNALSTILACLILASQVISAQDKVAEQPSRRITRVLIPTYMAESIAIKLTPPRDTGISGDAIVDVVVGKDGRVLHARGIAGDSRLIRAAQGAVMTWAFMPYHLNGEPIEFRTKFTIQFDGKEHMAKVKIDKDPMLSHNSETNGPDRPPQHR